MSCKWYLVIMPARNISKFSKMSLAEAARVSLENFEILLACLLPNTTSTTNHKKLNMKTKRRGDFPFRKRSLPFLTVVAIPGNGRCLL